MTENRPESQGNKARAHPAKANAFVLTLKIKSDAFSYGLLA
jgi:hypothetical protein